MGKLNDKNERVSICMNKSLHIWIKEYCKKNGISLSEWVRIKIMEEAKKR